MNYVQLYQAIQDYSENTEALFVANIPTFVQQAEERIYNTINFPSLRKNVTGTLTAGNKYLSLPLDWLATYSIAVIDTTTGNYQYLLNKDVNFIRESYPNPTTDLGLPRYYAIFGPQINNMNELSCILGPAPDQSYSTELHYFYYPATIVQGLVTVLSGFQATPGSGYVNGVYEGVPLTGGSGSGLTATITVAGGIVTAVTVDSGGQFYVVGDSLGVSNTYLGGSGSGFAVTVNSVSNADGHSWLGDNFDPVLLYGAMREAMLFMKGEADLVKYYEDKYQEALGLAKRLGDGLERGDAYRDGQTKLDVSGRGS